MRLRKNSVKIGGSNSASSTGSSRSGPTTWKIIRSIRRSSRSASVRNGIAFPPDGDHATAFRICQSRHQLSARTSPEQLRIGIAAYQLDTGLLRGTDSLPVMDGVEALGLVKSDWRPILARIARVVDCAGSRAQPLVLHHVPTSTSNRHMTTTA